jgi:hypothetical protein
MALNSKQFESQWNQNSHDEKSEGPSALHEAAYADMRGAALIMIHSKSAKRRQGN